MLIEAPEKLAKPTGSTKDTAATCCTFGLFIEGPFHVNQNLHTISVYVRNKPGVLVKIALVFSRRALTLKVWS